MIENRMILEASDIDVFNKIGSPYPGFKIDLVMIDYEGTVETNSKANFANKGTEGDSGFAKGGVSANLNQSKPSGSRNNDNIFSWRQKPDSSWCRNRTYGLQPSILPQI